MSSDIGCVLSVELVTRLVHLNSGMRGILSSHVGGLLSLEVITRLLHLNGGLCGILSGHVAGVLNVKVVTELMHLVNRHRGTLNSHVGIVLRIKSTNGSTKRIIVESRLQNGEAGAGCGLEQLYWRPAGQVRQPHASWRSRTVRNRVMGLIEVLVDVTIGHSRTSV